ncbi:hypothetical protein [Corynebacterium glyciniphilum]|uniref:hypothetical protein n=1 Tax=Corynebacterium glyciniphilum TaxID=1404244 RepID=UPI00264F65F7|nr:hypothetical protein [Corynebacterium glyciniphilum]MDN6705807.1 hypothetical protein [Corynebacterium glyciniphilum]
MAATAAATSAAVVGVLRSATWGSTREERRRSLPGDGLARAHLCADRAVTVPAPPKDVWPWLMQLGQDRGGFYSYEFLENIFGSDVHGVRDLRPEWSTRTVGDIVRLAPELPLIVHEVTQNEALVLVGGTRTPFRSCSHGYSSWSRPRTGRACTSVSATGSRAPTTCWSHRCWWWRPV